MSVFGFFLHHFLLCEINTPCISEYNIKRAHEYRIAMHQSVCVYSKHVITLFQTIVTTLKRDQTGLGFSIAGGRGSVPFKGNNQVHTHPHPPPFPVIWFYFRFIFHSLILFSLSLLHWVYFYVKNDIWKKASSTVGKSLIKRHWHYLLYQCLSSFVFVFIWFVIHFALVHTCSCMYM